MQTLLTSFTPEMQAELLARPDHDFLRRENLFAPTREQFEHWPAGPSPLARAFHVYARQFMLDDILVKVDRCSMLHSLEVRAPFLDKDFAEYVARLPIRHKLHGFQRKYLLKKAFTDVLPPEILHRNKRGFQIPWRPGCAGACVRSWKSFSLPSACVPRACSGPRPCAPWWTPTAPARPTCASRSDAARAPALAARPGDVTDKKEARYGWQPSGMDEGAGELFPAEKVPPPLALPHPFKTALYGLGKETRVHHRPGKTPHGLALFGTDSKRQGQAEARPLNEV